MTTIKHGRGDITELGRRIAARRDEEMAEAKLRAQPQRHVYDGRDDIACVLYVTGSIADGNSLFELETIGTLPHGIPPLKAAAPSLELAKRRLRWAFAAALMDKRRRIYTGTDASERARARAKAAELYIAEAPREGQT